MAMLQVSTKSHTFPLLRPTVTFQRLVVGESETYDKVIVLDNPRIAIDEYSILWVDSPPELMKDGSLVRDDNGEVVTPHDYIVKKVARSLNNVSIAISKVFVK